MIKIFVVAWHPKDFKVGLGRYCQGLSHVRNNVVAAHVRQMLLSNTLLSGEILIVKAAKTTSL